MEPVCSVLLLHGILADAGLAVLFVRDEDPARTGGGLILEPGAPGVAAAREPLSGGSWFGLRPGLAAGLVNRDPGARPGPRSRGLLLLDLLRGGGSLEAALADLPERAPAGRHGAFRLFLGDGRRLFTVDGPEGELPRPPQEVPAGAWILRHQGGLGEAPEAFRPRRGEDCRGWSRRALAALARHEPPGDPLCRHAKVDGGHASVNTTLAALDPAGRPLALAHGQGPPCRGRLREASEILAAWRGGG